MSTPTPLKYVEHTVNDLDYVFEYEVHAPGDILIIAVAHRIRQTHENRGVDVLVWLPPSDWPDLSAVLDTLNSE